MSTHPGEIAVQAALALRGRQYVFGGDFSNGKGGDCSALTMVAWAKAGIHLTHHAATQAEETSRVYAAHIGPLRPGDLAFYHIPITHVTMYLGHGDEVARKYGILGFPADWNVCIGADYPDAFGPGNGVGCTRLRMWSNPVWTPVCYGRPYYDGWK